MRYLQKMLFTLVGVPVLACLIGITFLASSPPVLSQQSSLKIYIDADRTGAIASGVSIEQGVRAGLASYGNQLNGRDVELVIRDHRGSTPRSKRHLNEFLKDKDALLVVSGLHSPPLLANREFINENKILTLDPWAAAGPITRPSTEDNWIFRLSVDDTKAGEMITRFAVAEGFKKPYLLLEDTGWGNSNLKTMSSAIKNANGTLMGVSRFKWGVGSSESESIAVKIKNSGADVVFLVANANEAKPLLTALMKNPATKHLPIRSHWGIAGGRFAEDVPAVVKNLDLKFIQTKFSFLSEGETAVTKKAFSTAQKLYPEVISKKEDIKAPTGFIHAYDLMLLLNEAAQQISWSGDLQQDHLALRMALESINKPVQGLVKLYKAPFSPYQVSSADAHEALGIDDMAMGQFDENGVIRLVK